MTPAIVGAERNINGATTRTKGAAFILAILPAPSVPDNPEIGLFKILVGLFWSLVCTSVALVLLRAKERVK